MKARIDYSAYELILGRLMVAIRNINAKRVYGPIGDDGVRILVDRLWPRGVSKDAKAIAKKANISHSER